MYCLIANVQSDHVLRTGAKVFVISSDQNAHQVEVVGLNKCGRRVSKYIAWKRLTNIRASFRPPDVATQCRLWWDNKVEVSKVAQELTEIWSSVRAFHPDGTLLIDGISAGEALRQYCAKKGIRNFTDVSPIESICERQTEIRKSGHYYACDSEKTSDLQCV